MQGEGFARFWGCSLASRPLGISAAVIDAPLQFLWGLRLGSAIYDLRSTIYDLFAGEERCAEEEVPDSSPWGYEGLVDWEVREVAFAPVAFGYFTGRMRRRAKILPDVGWLIGWRHSELVAVIVSEAAAQWVKLEEVSTT